MDNKKMNFNSFLIATVLLALGGIGTEIIKTHDAVITIQNNMVTKEKFDTVIAEIKAKQSDIETRQSRIEVEIQKLKNKP